MAEADTMTSSTRKVRSGSYEHRVLDYLGESACSLTDVHEFSGAASRRGARNILVRLRCKCLVSGGLGNGHDWWWTLPAGIAELERIGAADPAP